MLEFFRNLTRSSLIYGLGAAMGPIVGFFLLPIYTRYLTPSDYGILETLGTTTSIVTIFIIFGMDSSLFRFYFDSKDSHDQKRVLGTTTIFLWALAILVTAGLAANAGSVSQLLFRQSGLGRILDVAFVSAAVAATLKIPMLVFRIQNQPARYATISLVQTLLTASLCIFFVVGLKAGVFGIMVGTFIAATVTTLAAYYLVRGEMGFGFSFDLLRGMLAYSAPVLLAGLALWVSNLSDRYFLLAYSTTTELGLYSIGNKFASAAGLAISAFTLAWPQAAFSVLDQDQEGRNRLYSRALTYFVFASCSIVLVLSLFGDQLVALMTTQEFFGGAKVIPILGLALVFSGCYTIFAIGLNITKRMGRLLAVSGIPAVLNLVLNYLLIPPYGMMGAAWSTLASYLLMALLSWRASERVYHIDYEWRKIGEIFCVMLLVLAASKFVVVEQLYYSILIELGLFGVYLLVLYLMKIPGKGAYTGMIGVLSALMPAHRREGGPAVLSSSPIRDQKTSQVEGPDANHWQDN